MGSIRVAFVASAFGVGGAERVMSSLASRLPRDRFDTRWLFLRDAGPVGREIFAMGHRGEERVAPGAHDPTAALRLAARMRRWRPHIAFCMDHHNAMLWGRLGALLARVPATVVASHSTGLFGRRGSFRAWDRWLMEFTDRVVALSASHAAYLRGEGVDAGRIAVIGNGVDTEMFRPPDDAEREAARIALGVGGRPVVLMVAALRPEKAHEALLDAAARLDSAGDCPDCLIVGDGALRGALEARCRERGLHERVRFLGVRDDVARLLHAADVLVLPSHDVVETLPLAVLEAMASGVPVVASRVGSLPEVIEDGRNGFLIDPADGLSLAGRIAYIVGDPEGALGMGRAARETVESRYSLDRMTDGYCTMFEELAA